ncbi:hypothetical protein niasHS_012306 [Heterodera schachtii]|uniref:Ferric reductase NAD binding domain-containing protein n=1 Tax=Heterodera schachtii TaxID=97005 RepID=A0ABD2IGJ1_HETSC
MCLFHSPLVSYGIEGKQQRTWRLWSAVYFLWICPAHKNFEWFVDVLKEVERHNQDGILEIHIFVTQMFNKLIFEQLYCISARTAVTTAALACSPICVPPTILDGQTSTSSSNFVAKSAPRICRDRRVQQRAGPSQQTNSTRMH